jgi:hypothetical protein
MQSNVEMIAMDFLLWSLIALLPFGQQTRVDTSGGGVGPAGAKAFAAWVGRNTVDFGPLRLQVLVVWHGGNVNWNTDVRRVDEKGIHTATRLFEFRVHDDSVTIDGQKVPLDGINVILVEVEPTQTRIVETLYIDTVVPERGTEDPLETLLRRYPRLAEFAELQP